MKQQDNARLYELQCDYERAEGDYTLALVSFAQGKCDQERLDACAVKRNEALRQLRQEPGYIE